MLIPKKSYKISRIPTEKERESINIFKERALDFIEERERICPKQIHIGAKRLDCGEYIGSSNLPDRKKLKTFYLAFRFFYQQKEPSNFLKVRNIISNISSGDHEMQYLKSIKDMWNYAMSELHNSDFLNKKITGDEIIRLWFNASIFHSDIDKRKRLKTMNNLLSETLSSAFLFLTVFKAGAPVGLLYKTIKNLSAGNLMISVPDDYIKYA